MKIYEYAKKRNIKSRDVVKKIHDLGYKHIKNHLSLVPLKIIDKLDEFDFAPKKKKLQPKTNIFISLECAPFSKSGISEIVRNKIKKNKRNKNHIIIPRNQIDMKLDIFLERNVIIDKKKIKGTVYKTQYKNDIYYLIEDKFINDKEIYQLAFFSLMAIETVKFLNNKIDKINIHDWELGLFPLMFKKIKSQFYNTIVEFSIYGATYKGIYAKNIENSTIVL